MKIKLYYFIILFLFSSSITYRPVIGVYGVVDPIDDNTNHNRDILDIFLIDLKKYFYHFLQSIFENIFTKKLTKKVLTLNSKHNNHCFIVIPSLTQ